MCGIAGAFSLTVESQKIVKLVQDVLEYQYFRGPDNTGTESLTIVNRPLILGHNRLSIIDLSNDANQPLFNRERTHCIVFNGEIYNYIEIRKELQTSGTSFYTESDTEVLLSAFLTWGPNALDRFNGMFAFAIVDLVAKRIFLARDRFGVKPLYYFFDGKTFAFSSTAGMIAQHLKLNPNLYYLSKGLSYWVYEDDSEMTQYERLKAIRPGHFIQITIKENNLLLTENRYYNLRARVLAKKEKLLNFNDSQNINEFIETFGESIKLRLRADVRLGVSLSGGVDSSTVASFASQFSNNVIGISYGRPDQTQSEGPLVKLLSESLNMEVQFVWPTEKEMLDAFWDSFEAQESPIYGLSYIAEYLVYRQARESGIRVMLGGQGGDETFMGYRKYLFFYLRYLIQKKDFTKAAALFKDLIKNFYYQRSHLRGYGLSLKRYIKSSGIRPNLNLPSFSLDISFNPKAELWERQLVDVLTTSIPTQLKSEDRNSMRNSIETRLPFLDYNIVELGLALNNDMKIRDGFGKWIVRKVSKGRVPNAIRWARFKRGFDVTQDLMKKGLSDQIYQRLNDNFEIIKDYVSSQQMLKMYTGENMNKSNLLFQEAMTLLWLIKNRR